jgi:hypothetical protein
MPQTHHLPRPPLLALNTAPCPPPPLRPHPPTHPPTHTPTACLPAQVGSDRDAAEQMAPLGPASRSFLLHYAFPPASVNETGARQRHGAA